MTFFAYDGVNLLMDKVTQVKWHDPRDNFKKDHNGEVMAHFEKTTKIHGIDKPAKAMSWDKGILCYTTIGKEDDVWKKFVEETTMDLRVFTNLSPLYLIHDKETRYVWIEDNGALCYTYYDYKTGEFKTRECLVPTYKEHGYTTFFGYGTEELNSWESMCNLKLTPLEGLVVMQARHQVLGRRFDCLHVPTRTLTTDHDLSDRQRRIIIDRVQKRINLTRECPEIWLSNVSNYKERV